MQATPTRPRDERGRLLPKAPVIEVESVIVDDEPALLVTVDEDPFEPVEYWNAVNPNQHLRVRKPGPLAPDHDPAADPEIRFLAGYYRATEPWEVAVIDRELAGVAHRADSPSEWTCQKCGWVTRSQKAFAHHIAQHS
jgi:hypothetical protein